MHVLSAGLGADDFDRLGQAAARNAITLREIMGDDRPLLEDGLLAVFQGASVPTSLSAATVRSHGAYVVQVHDDISATSVLTAVRSGYSFVFGSPLRVDRIASFLAYLRDVAPPERTQILQLDVAAGLLSTSEASVALSAAESAAIRIFGERINRIVSRADLAAVAAGADPLQITRALQRHFAELGSGCQILKVPHMGYRFVGTLRINREAVQG